MFENFHLKIDGDLELGPYTLENAQDVYDVVMANYEHLYEYSPWLDENYSMDRARAFAELCTRQYADGSLLPVRIIYRGKTIGGTGFHAINWNYRSTEIGYWLSKDFIGQGIVTRCCAALLDYGFNDLDLNRIGLKCEPENTKSRAIAERLGFTMEGIEREGGIHHGKCVDFVVYSMLASEWKAQKRG